MIWISTDNVILAGLTPLKTADMANYMAKNAPGVKIPKSILKCTAGVPKEKAREEGIKTFCEQVK